MQLGALWVFVVVIVVVDKSWMSCVTLHLAVLGAKTAEMQREQEAKRNMAVHPDA